MGGVDQPTGGRRKASEREKPQGFYATRGKQARLEVSEIGKHLRRPLGENNIMGTADASIQQAVHLKHAASYILTEFGIALCFVRGTSEMDQQCSQLLEVNPFATLGRMNALTHAHLLQCWQWHMLHCINLFCNVQHAVRAVFFEQMQVYDAHENEHVCKWGWAR